MNLKSIIIVIVAAMALALPLSATSGEKTVGLRAGYNTRGETAVAGVMFQYRFSDHFRLSPNIDYYFRHNGVDGLSFDVNAHFPLSIAKNGRFNCYPLAGVNFTSWDYHFIDDNNDDISNRETRLGLNVGAGLEYYATPTLKLSFEAKASILKQYSSGTFNLSIGYVF